MNADVPLHDQSFIVAGTSCTDRTTNDEYVQAHVRVPLECAIRDAVDITGDGVRYVYGRLSVVAEQHIMHDRRASEEFQCWVGRSAFDNDVRDRGLHVAVSDAKGEVHWV